MKFKTTILQFGNNTGIEVPVSVIEQLGAGKKPPVVITLKEYTYRSTVAVMGGKYLVGLSAEHRKNSGVAGGDSLEVTIVLDTAPRIVDVPKEFQQRLDAHPTAKARYEALAPSKKKALVLSITEAKTEDTKQRRMEKAIQVLLENN